MKICDFLTLDSLHQWPLIRQIGIESAVAKLSPQITGTRTISDIDTLAGHQKTYRENGFEIIALEGDQFDMTRIKEGRDGRDEDLEHYCRMLQNMGELGIGLLCYNFMARIGWYRNQHNIPERGGALVSAYAEAKDSEVKPDPNLTEERLWDNYQYFLRAVLPTAERAGVVLALHPDDPPRSPVNGIGRIFKSITDFEKALSLSNSSSHRVTFCQANFRLMDAGGLIENITNFGRAGKIAYVHWRDVEGDKDNFRETFHDNGPTDMAATLIAYREAGVDVPIRVDHVPALHGESHSSGYTFLGRLHAIGYLQGMLQAG